MRVIANNLANVGTTAYKRDRANFATLAYQDARVAGQQSSSETAYATGLNLGTGVGVQSTTRIETQGEMQTTGSALDIAIEGDGYFQIQMPGGQLGYTRAGNFTRSAEGNLVTAQGYAVQGRNHFNLTPGKTSSIAVPIFRNGHFEAAMTMVFFIAAMKLSNALEQYLEELKATAAAISHDLSNGVPAESN